MDFFTTLISMELNVFKIFIFNDKLVLHISLNIAYDYKHVDFLCMNMQLKLNIKITVFFFIL